MDEQKPEVRIKIVESPLPADTARFIGQFSTLNAEELCDAIVALSMLTTLKNTGGVLTGVWFVVAEPA